MSEFQEDKKEEIDRTDNNIYNSESVICEFDENLKTSEKEESESSDSDDDSESSEKLESSEKFHHSIEDDDEDDIENFDRLSSSSDEEDENVSGCDSFSPESDNSEIDFGDENDDEDENEEEQLEKMLNVKCEDLSFSEGLDSATEKYNNIILDAKVSNILGSDESFHEKFEQLEQLFDFNPIPCFLDIISDSDDNERKNTYINFVDAIYDLSEDVFEINRLTESQAISILECSFWKNSESVLSLIRIFDESTNLFDSAMQLIFESRIISEEICEFVLKSERLTSYLQYIIPHFREYDNKCKEILRRNNIIAQIFP